METTDQVIQRHTPCVDVAALLQYAIDPHADFQIGGCICGIFILHRNGDFQIAVVSQLHRAVCCQVGSRGIFHCIAAGTGGDHIQHNVTHAVLTQRNAVIVGFADVDITELCGLFQRREQVLALEQDLIQVPIQYGRYHMSHILGQNFAIFNTKVTEGQLLVVCFFRLRQQNIRRRCGCTHRADSHGTIVNIQGV